MVSEHSEQLRREYEGRLADLERERESIEEEKAQVDRYAYWSIVCCRSVCVCVVIGVLRVPCVLIYGAIICVCGCT